MSESKNKEVEEETKQETPAPKKEGEDDQDGEENKLSATEQRKRDEYLKLQRSLKPSGSAIEILKEEARQKMSEKNSS